MNGALRADGASADTVARIALDIAAHPGRVTVRAIGFRVGHSASTVHAALVALREAGLVDWRAGFSGTLRSRMTVVTPDSVSSNETPTC